MQYPPGGRFEGVQIVSYDIVVIPSPDLASYGMT